MQKKLYFLDESEKNRILNLHESRTKKQYLLNEALLATTVSFNNKINSKCDTEYTKKTWGDSEIEKWAEVFKKNLGTSLFYQSNNYLENYVKYNINALKNFQNFCAVAKKYEEITGKKLMTRFTTFISSDNAWKKYVEVPISSLPNVNVKDDTGDEEQEKPEDAKFAAGIDSQNKGSSYFSPSGWGSHGSSYDTQILKALGVDDDTLTDEHIKTIYDKLKKAGRIT